MSEPSTGPHEAGRYEIRLKGHLDTRWATWFDGLALTRESGGTTVLQGPVADQAALYGVLQKVRDLGLPLISVIQIAPRSRPASPIVPPPSPDMHSPFTTRRST